ncbi:iron-siderophore ABC transporter substrate-binding protein [Rhizobiaceae bacterium BDR2-2]|uniref:Iron-siderophore ABC transporter substrate-binding protein n=1 Tax=Ectorhizobium quercum TaxID=2965071 RepID=A0AAE3SX06_9HYPH|nr:iron-siderophore ABC transporter substrate-binding protein [Ectorhizobium quercum]MCX8999742.1 iron-siderophore ABC transporter substrate-binding protein [Ectorhizobium quercum]
MALDQQTTEYLLALGLQPAGVTGPANYRRFTGDEEPRLAGDVVDLGLFSAPNIELIMALEPDLIVGNVSSVQKSLSMLREIAPVAAFLSQPSGSSDQFGNMSATLRVFAMLTGRQTEGEAFLASLDAGLAEARARFKTVGLGGRPVILGNVNAGVTGAEIMLFNANALPAQILARCGFDYGQDDARFADKGFTVTTAESLIAFQDADFLYMPFNAKGVENLMSTPVWRNLNFVREGRVHAVPYRLIHNGPLSARLFLRDVQKALLP